MLRWPSTLNGRTPHHFQAANRNSSPLLGEKLLTPPETGSYQFVLIGTDQACLLVDGIVVLHRFEGGATTTGKSLDLTAGTAYRLRVELWPSRSDLRVNWGDPPWALQIEEDNHELVEAARRADAVLFWGLEPSV